MIIPAILCTLKGKLLLDIWAVFTTIAVTEAFLGQLMIAVIVALIGAAPPTAAIIIMSRKQSAERRTQNDEVLKAVDGQTSKLVEATQKFSHLAGKEEERVESRLREGEAAIAQAAAAAVVLPGAPVLPGSSAESPVHTKITNTTEDPANVKPVKGDL